MSDEAYDDIKNLYAELAYEIDQGTASQDDIKNFPDDIMSLFKLVRSRFSADFAKQVKNQIDEMIADISSRKNKMLSTSDQETAYDDIKTFYSNMAYEIDQGTASQADIDNFPTDIMTLFKLVRFHFAPDFALNVLHQISQMIYDILYASSNPKQADRFPKKKKKKTKAKSVKKPKRVPEIVKDFDKMTVKDLRALMKQNGLSGISKPKAQLKRILEMHLFGE